MNIYDFEFKISTEVKFGRNKINELTEILKTKDKEKLMIVVDEGIKKAGVLEKIEVYLDSKVDYCVFDQVRPDPTISVVKKGLEKAIDEKIDSLLALGGGSSIDTAKAIRAAYESEKLEQKPKKFDKLLLITVPTTSGSGSEVTKTIVITDEINKHKFAANSEDLVPEVAIVDPNLTKSLPAKLTAIGGMDALSHCVEAYVSQDSFLPFEMIAAKGIELVNENLRPAVGNPDNMKAREGMSLASLFGGVSFSNCGLGLVHAIAHPLGGKYDIPHGLANSILLPEVMKFNLIAKPEKFANITKLMGRDIENMTKMEAAKQSAVEVEKLVSDISLPTSLSEFGVENLEEIAELALQEKVMLKSNPRMVEKQDVINIIENLL